MENTENRNTVLCSALRKTKLWTGPASRCSWNLQLASRQFVRASFYYPCISHNTTDGEEFLPLFPFFLIHRFGLLRDTVAGTIEEIATDAYTYVDVCMRGRVKGLTTSMESGEEERPSSRARETARSRTLSTCQASWEASFPSMASLISFSALSTAAVVPIALLRLGALLLSSPLLSSGRADPQTTVDQL